ncbi:MAG TPA: winged helix-turn-helix domain-containing protein [Rhodanobacteraceae bacterium]|nr:winged helix-turn-helix domain-containing protein [Rhodanobacteraceae bacterium]
MAQKKRADRSIERAAEIQLLASPARIELVDTLEALGGEASVAELAAQLGRPADGLYYHLRQLAAAGLLVETATPEGRRYRTRMPEGERLTLRYRPGRTANAGAVDDVAASVLRVAGRDFSRALADSGSVVEGPQRELWAARYKGWVGDAELAEINRLLVRISDLLHRPRAASRDRLVALAFVLAPVDAKPARRAQRPAR